MRYRLETITPEPMRSLRRHRLRRPPPPPPPPPDLVITAFTWGSVTVKNLGPGPAGPFRLRAGDATRTVVQSFAGLAPGASETRALTRSCARPPTSRWSTTSSRWPRPTRPTTPGRLRRSADAPTPRPWDLKRPSESVTASGRTPRGARARGPRAGALGRACARRARRSGHELRRRRQEDDRLRRRRQRAGRGPAAGRQDPGGGVRRLEHGDDGHTPQPRRVERQRLRRRRHAQRRTSSELGPSSPTRSRCSPTARS